MVPTFSCPMITGSSKGGLRYIFTSVPQMPATSTLSSAESSATLGMGSSRNSVVFGAVRTAARTCSTMHSPLDIGVRRRWHYGQANIPSWVTDATTIPWSDDDRFGTRSAHDDPDPGEQPGHQGRHRDTTRPAVGIRGDPGAGAGFPPDGADAGVRRQRDGIDHLPHCPRARRRLHRATHLLGPRLPPR